MSKKPNLTEFEDEDRFEQIRRANESLQRQVVRLRNRDEELVKAVTSAAYDAAAAYVHKPIAPIRDTRRRGEEVALWHMTDWQGAKVTPSYNSQVMKRRVHQFVQTAESITDIQRADHPVKNCVIMFGGDMVEGLFNFPTQPFEVDATIFDQWITVGMLLVDVVNAALRIYEKVTVVAEWGNHGRIGSKRDNVPKSDNIDRMSYELARRLLENETRLTWQDCPEDIQRVEIGNYRALLMHGDEIGRAGFASPAAWIAAGNRWKAGSYRVDGEPWRFNDIYLGHYHRNASEPMSDGAAMIYWTGSTESDNRYARDSMAVSGTPSQRLHFVHPEKGRVTAAYNVWLED
jgi:hypothetical protein